MKKTTLCYIRNNGCWLMLYRNRKPDDMNEGKWLGIGGKIEAGESPDECNAREILEETGLIALDAAYRGLIEFRSDEYEDEDMYLYSCDEFEPADQEARRSFGDTGAYVPPGCSEGVLRWIPEDELLDLPMWEGDRAFLTRLMAGDDDINLRLSYEGEHCRIEERTATGQEDMR